MLDTYRERYGDPRAHREELRELTERLTPKEGGGGR